MGLDEFMFFFFSSRRRHTRLQGDWSSDVCSSDLERDGDGLPWRWIEMVRHTLSGTGPRALASRMVREYVTELYTPAASASRILAGPAAGGGRYGAARELAGWRRRISCAWPGVRIEHVEAVADELKPGGRLTVRAAVALGELSPADVTVELVHGAAGGDDEVTEPARAPLYQEEGPSGGSACAGVLRYCGVVKLDRPGTFGYTVRVLPHHELLASHAELGLAVLPAVPAGMTSGDLR